MQKIKVILINLPCKNIYKIFYKKDRVLYINKNFDGRHKITYLHK